MAEKEYIEREAATAYAPLPKELREYQTGNLDDAFEYGYDFAIGQIEAIPAADVVERKTGTWGIFLTADQNVYECSECGKPWFLIDGDPYDNDMYYCPRCGAKMEG